MHPERSRSHGPGGLKRCSACGEEKRAAAFPPELAWSAPLLVDSFTTVALDSAGGNGHRTPAALAIAQDHTPGADQEAATAPDARQRVRALIAREHAGGPQVTAAEVVAVTGRSRRRAYELLRDARTEHEPGEAAMDVRVIYRDCPACGRRFGQPDDPGRKRRFCSDACKQAAYPARKRAREQARQRAQDDARRQQREEQARRQRDRTRRTPPRTPGPAAPALTAGPAAATAVPTPLTTTRPPTTAPGAATTADTPRPPRPGSPRKPPTAGPSRAAPGQVRSVGDDGRIVTRPSTEQGERYGSSATAATNGS